MSRSRLIGLIGCGLLLLGLTVIGLDLQQRDDIRSFVAVALAQGGVYLIAVWLIWHSLASRWVMSFILGLAVLWRIVVILAPPYLSTDIYRYVWDGRVIAAGINPYRYIPTDPHLETLRDGDIFLHINRGNYAPTIYPPLAELIFYWVTRVSESLTAMKTAMVVFELVTIAVLLALLIAAGQPAGRVIAYAWHPLPVWEFAGSGHIDAALVAATALALWAHRHIGGRAVGTALAAGTLIKFYPAVILPALWRRWDWRMPAVFAAVIGLAYLPFLGVGRSVFGFLPGYMTEEGFASGGGFYLSSLVALVLPLGRVLDLAYLAAAGVLAGGLATYVVLFRRADDDPIPTAALLAGLFILLLSPHYPWYFAWLLVFACLVPAVSLLWLTAASFLLYLVPVGSQLVRDRPRFIVDTVLYLPFIVLAVMDLRRQRARHSVREQPAYVDTAG